MANPNINSAFDQKRDLPNAGVNYFRPRYVKSLDGIRGVLMVVVLLTHLEILGPNVGFIAVDCFFVLSGFLITWLLITEWNNSSTINLLDFYYRRALRLLPVLFTMLAAFALYTCLANPRNRVARDFHYIFEAVFYFTNWGQITGLGERLNFLAQTWSLSIEEQFYILWPPILLLLLRRTESKTSLLCWTILAAFSVAFMRAVYVEIDNPAWSGYWRLSRALDTRADSLLTGCAAGMLISGQYLPRRRWLEWALFVAAIVSIVGLIWLSRQYLFDPWMYSVGWLLASIFTVIVIVHLVFSPKSILHWMLEPYPLVYIGIISYGLYVWHFPIFRIFKTQFPVHWRVLAVSVSIAVTLSSYYLVERPCLRLKKRFYRAGKPAKPVSAQALCPADS